VIWAWLGVFEASVRPRLAVYIVVADILNVGGTMTSMAASSTTTVEIDSNLLERLRQRRPAKSDRELLESVARIQLGREASDRAAKRFQGVSADEIADESVKAVREVRRERTALS
jgi:hypothetical protein